MSTKDKIELGVHIRWLIRRDQPEVLAIERASFACPWTEDEFLALLRVRNCIGMVAEHAERVVGFMVYELHKGRLHVRNFAVAPEFRRQGVGRRMIAKLRGKLSSYGRTSIDLEIAETNLPGQRFFAAQGFRATEILRERFVDTGEDAYVMQYVFADTTG